MLKTIKTLYQFHLRYKWWLLASVFFSLCIATTSSLAPYFYQFFVNTITSSDYSNLSIIVVLFLIVIFLDNILDVFLYYSIDRYLLPSSRDARVKIFDHVQQLDFAYHTEKNTGSLISAFKRGDGAFFDLTHVFVDILRILIQFVILVITFSLVNPKYTFVAIILLVLNLLQMRFLVPLNVNKRTDFNNHEDKVSGKITENLLNYDTVKFFAKEKRELTELKSMFERWLSALWSYALSFRIIEIVETTITVLGYGATIILLYLDLKSNQINPGQFILVITFLGSFFDRMRSLFGKFRSIAKNYADIKKYFGLLEDHVSVKDPENPRTLRQIQGEVTFDQVTFNYPRNNKVIKDFNLTIKPGESVALVGKSGSGKTTITKLILRFYDPQAGVIRLDGVDIREINKSHLRAFMGVVPQEPILFNDTIAYNIGYGHNRPTKMMVKRAARMANLDRFIESLPEKYDTIVGERGIKLSGGQKQRLAIARMILSNPKIIIFDEATSQLDSVSEKLIQDAFWKIAKFKTTIIIAHRLSTVRRADRIIVLDKGKIAEEGTHGQLIKDKNGHYAKLWQLQSEAILA